MSKEIECKCGSLVAVLESGSKWANGATANCKQCTDKRRDKDKEFMNSELGKMFKGFSK